MKITFDNDQDELFFILGKLAGFLSKPELVEVIRNALGVPHAGDMMRGHLLIANATLTEILEGSHTVAMVTH